MSASEVKLHIQASDVETHKFLRASYDQNLQITIYHFHFRERNTPYTREMIYLWYLYLLMGQCRLKMIMMVKIIILFPFFGKVYRSAYFKVPRPLWYHKYQTKIKVTSQRINVVCTQLYFWSPPFLIVCVLFVVKEL